MKTFIISSFCTCLLAFEIKEFVINNPDKEECVSEACLRAVEKPTFEAIADCRATTASTCGYNGTFAYDGDLFSDVVVETWESGLTVYGVPPIIRDHEIHAIYTSQTLELHINFEELEGESTSARRCVYMLSNTIPLDVSPPMEPSQTCDQYGLPIQYMISPTLQVGFLLVNETISPVSNVRLNALAIMSESVHVLVEPLDNYVFANATLHGDLKFWLTPYRGD